MAFLEDIGKKLSKAGQDVTQATKNVADKVKLSNAVADEKKNIERLYCAIGQKYFADHCDDAEPAFAEFIKGIKEANARIADYNDQLNKLKGVIICQNCGAEIPANAAFCNMCGAKVERPEPQPAAEAVKPNTCYVCGAELESGAKFCTRCGTPMAKEE